MKNQKIRGHQQKNFPMRITRELITKKSYKLNQVKRFLSFIFFVCAQTESWIYFVLFWNVDGMSWYNICIKLNETKYSRVDQVRQPLKNLKWLWPGLADHISLQTLKGCLPQILLGPILHTLSQMLVQLLTFEEFPSSLFSKAILKTV